MKKIMNILMLSCKKASELIEKKSIVQLSRIETIQLHVHKSMCDACNTYEKHSLLIDEVIQQKISNKSEKNIPHLRNEPLKQKIKNDL